MVTGKEKILFEVYIWTAKARAKKKG